MKWKTIRDRRNIILELFEDGWTQEQIAAEIGCSSRTVRSDFKSMGLCWSHKKTSELSPKELSAWLLREDNKTYYEIGKILGTSEASARRWCKQCESKSGRPTKFKKWGKANESKTDRRTGRRNIRGVIMVGKATERP